MACQNNKHLVNTLLLLNIFRCWPPASLELGIFVYTHFTEIFTFLHGPAVHLCGFTCVDSIQHLQHSNCGSTPTNVTFSCQSLSCKHMHTCNTLLHREPCCVLSGGTQMAATWCVLMGSCDGFGQDMDTHTDGDPLRVDGRWTCWLLICSDQWFTTWSSDTGGVAPTELAHWLGTFGTHQCIYAEHKSMKFISVIFSKYFAALGNALVLNTFFIALITSYASKGFANINHAKIFVLAS